MLTIGGQKSLEVSKWVRNRIPHPSGELYGVLCSRWLLWRLSMKLNFANYMNQQGALNPMNEEVLEQVMRVRWNADEHLDDHARRGVIVAAMKLVSWRSCRGIFRWRIARIAMNAWIEARSFISYERGRFFVDYGGTFMRRVGCVHVFDHEKE